MATSESKIITRSASQRLCYRCRRINLDLVLRKSHLTNLGNEVPGWNVPVDRDTIKFCIFMPARDGNISPLKKENDYKEFYAAIIFQPPDAGQRMGIH